MRVQNKDNSTLIDDTNLFTETTEKKSNLQTEQNQSI